MRWLVGLIWMLTMTASATAQPGQGQREPVQVLVLGTYHFGNPGRDLHNAKVDDVLEAKRQHELEQLAQALAAFRPTKIMVERIAKTPDLIDPDYSQFTSANLAKDRDEHVQIGYRLANRVKLGAVHAIDEQPSEDEPDYFPFPTVAAWAKANNAEGKLQALMAKGAAITAKLEADQKTKTIPQMLLDRNRVDVIEEEQGLYYEFLRFGGIDQQPGADLNAMWYLRNAKIFNKLQQAAKPGDRVLVVYGSGHNYWLRHFAATAPGYQLVDPIPYLDRATRR